MSHALDGAQDGAAEDFSSSSAILAGLVTPGFKLPSRGDGAGRRRLAGVPADLVCPVIARESTGTTGHLGTRSTTRPSAAEKEEAAKAGVFPDAEFKFDSLCDGTILILRRLPLESLGLAKGTPSVRVRPRRRQPVPWVRLAKPRR